VKAFEFEHILNVVLSSFNIRYVDFDQDQFRCYKERRIGGVVRIDTGEIMIDKNLSEAERDRTWIHENMLHIQMHFKNPQERDTLWNRASEKLAENIEKGIKKTTDENERLEIENILCAVRSER